jgi:hypothetical protein
MIRTQISMTEEQAAALRRLAALRERSQAALLRDALDRLIEEEEAGRRVGRARAVFGAFDSGHRDTSVRHDDVLDEAYAE